MVDYACFFVKCINYQIVISSMLIYFLQVLARFLQKLHFLQEKQRLQNFCKKWESVERLLQEFCKMYFLQELCKSCIDCKDFAKFLQKLFFFWTRVSLSPTVGRSKLPKVFMRRIIHINLAYAPDNLCNSRIYQPAERRTLERKTKCSLMETLTQNHFKMFESMNF